MIMPARVLRLSYRRCFASNLRKLHFCRPIFSDAEEPPSTSSHWFIKMPYISEDEKFGKVTRWTKMEGEKVYTGDNLCEVEFNEFSINLSMEEDSYVAQIMMPASNESVPIGTPLCALVRNKEDIAPFRASHKLEHHPASGWGFTPKDVMLVINHILKAGDIKEDMASHLLFLARQGNEDIFKAFEGSFQGEKFEENGIDGFDTNLFLLQAKDIVESLFPMAKESPPQ